MALQGNATPTPLDSPSFSVIYFAGNILDALLGLLTDCNYRLIEQTSDKGNFTAILDRISQVAGRTIVYKAAYAISTGVVLLDPEMVVGTIQDQPLQAFCSTHRTVARIAIWERFTKSVIARQISAAGVDIDFLSIGDNTPRKPVNAPADLVRWPGPERLKEFLASGGASVSEMFGEISTRIFKLDESKMLPSPH